MTSVNIYVQGHVSSRDPSDPMITGSHMTMTRKPQFSEDLWSQVNSSISPDVRWCQREFPSTYICPGNVFLKNKTIL